MTKPKLIYTKPRAVSQNFKFCPEILDYINELAAQTRMTPDRILNRILYNTFNLRGADVDYEKIAYFLDTDVLD